jgi:hypothetical protein
MRRVKTGWVAQREKGASWKLDGIKADGIYICPTAGITYIHLAGTKDGEAGPRLEIPTDAVLLRELATAFEELAEWRERGAWGPFHP